MFRVSKTLLCALVADVSLASRQTGTVMNMMDSIGSLLQTREASTDGAVHSRVMNNLRLLASITPGQSDSMNDILTRVITLIEQNVETPIKAGLDGTQEAIGEAINQLSGTTTTAGDDKSNADNADRIWFNCIRDEKANREAIEEADAAMKQSRSNENEPCQAQQDMSAFEYSLQPANFHCDFSSTGNCDGPLTEYRKEVNDMVNDMLKVELSKKQGLYDQSKDDCQEAKDETKAQSNAMDDSIDAWNDKQLECLTKHESRMQNMCNFGTSLQRKCKEATVYTNLIAEVNKVNGGEHSQPDREQEWKTTQVTKCMLSKIIVGGSIDAATLEACDTDATSVGEVDRMQAAFAELTTAEKFSCSETAIQFTGQTWNVPDGEAPASSEYTAEDYAPRVDLREDLEPFAFCGGASVAAQ